MSKSARAAKPIAPPAQPDERPIAKPIRSGVPRPGQRALGPRAARSNSSSSSTIPRPARHGALANPDNRLQLAIALSVLVHMVALTLHFKFPEVSVFRHKDSQLEVVLVNSKSAARPDKPQARAQNNLDGGGNTDEDRRAKTPLPASQQKRDGDALVEARRRVEQLEAMQQRLMTQVKAKAAVMAAQNPSSEQPDTTPAPASGHDLADRALAIAKLEAQIDRNLDEYQKRPRKKFIGARTSEYAPAQYIEAWRQKIERIGTLNYPEAARGKHYGSLLLYIEIKSDGDINRVEIQRSSGIKILDDAALRIVRLSSPFAAFPAEMRDKIDILAFARTWTFTNSDSVATSAARD